MSCYLRLHWFLYQLLFFNDVHFNFAHCDPAFFLYIRFAFLNIPLSLCPRLLPCSFLSLSCSLNNQQLVFKCFTKVTDYLDRGEPWKREGGITLPEYPKNLMPTRMRHCIASHYFYSRKNSLKNFLADPSPFKNFLTSREF